MAEWVLILWLGGYHGGPAILGGFTSQEKCVAGARDMREAAEKAPYVLRGQSGFACVRVER